MTSSKFFDNSILVRLFDNDVDGHLTVKWWNPVESCLKITSPICYQKLNKTPKSEKFRCVLFVSSYLISWLTNLQSPLKRFNILKCHKSRGFFRDSVTFSCAYHPAAPGSNPNHTIYTFFNLYYWNCNEKRTKINKKRPDWPV